MFEHDVVELIDLPRVILARLTAAPRLSQPTQRTGALYLEDHTGVIVCEITRLKEAVQLECPVLCFALSVVPCPEFPLKLLNEQRGTATSTVYLELRDWVPLYEASPVSCLNVLKR